MDSRDRSPRILIADDQPDVREALRLLFKGEGYAVKAVQSPSEALGAVDAEEFNLVLMDLNYTRDTTSGQEGLDLLNRIRSVDPTLPVVVMTAWANVELAVDAMRRGASDFVQKPWDNERMLTTVRTHLELGRALRSERRLEAENELLRGELAGELVGRAPAMQVVVETIERIGPTDANVLITGENGAGKGVVARALHRISPRRGKSLVTVNMGGFSEGVFESELFGHVKGAFTDAKTDRVGRFELADGGTLFLDEIANLSPAQQTRLLRVLETGEFERVGSSRTRRADVRIISATNADLAERTRNGTFRQDLLFRLNTIQLQVPPLRERREDIPALARHFLDIHLRRYRREIDGFEPAAVDRLMQHAWPGNVRELSHAVERGVLMCRGSRIAAGDLGLDSRQAAAPDLDHMTLEEAEQLLIRRALDRAGGNANEAANALGLSRSALYRRLEKMKSPE